MIKKIISFFAFLISFIFFCNAEIIESDTLLSVLNYPITAKTVIIFDIDNTLARPIESVGSDEWFCYLVNTKMLEGNDYITSVYYALPAAFYAHFNLPLKLLESSTPLLIKYFIVNNIAVMALSTRSLFIAERTLEQLKNIGICFFMPTIPCDDYVLPMNHPCFYKEGILFSGNNDKGEALIQFFDTMNYYPEVVIFVDDKMKYLLAVEKAVEERNIIFHGIRYSGCDDEVKNFDPIQAETQYEQLKERHKQ